MTARPADKRKLPPPKIEVEAVAEGQFQVRVTEGKSETRHRVTLSTPDYDRIAGGKIGQLELVRRSFEFLLEREPKESILGQFDLTVISRYFPEYQREIERGFQQ